MAIIEDIGKLAGPKGLDIKPELPSVTSGLTQSGMLDSLNRINRAIVSTDSIPQTKPVVKPAIDNTVPAVEATGLIKKAPTKEYQGYLYGQFSDWVKDHEGTQNRARINYYHDRLDRKLFGEEYDKYVAMRDSLPVTERAAFADEMMKSGKFNKQLTPEEIKADFGPEKYADYVKTKGQVYRSNDKLKGSTNSDPMIYALRNSFTTPKRGYTKREYVGEGEDGHVGDFFADMTWSPEDGYKTTVSITKDPFSNKNKK